MDEQLENIRFYKIRDLQSGLFSRGGVGPAWDKHGKVWRDLTTIRQHLAQFKYWDDTTNTFVPDPRMERWEVIEYEPRVVRTVNAGDVSMRQLKNGKLAERPQ